MNRSQDKATGSEAESKLVPEQLPPNPTIDQIIDSLPQRPLDLSPSKPPFWKRPKMVISIILVVLILLITASVTWFSLSLRAVEPGSNELVQVEVAPGSSSASIAQALADAGLVRSETAFHWYVRLSGAASTLQSGEYRLSKSDNAAALVEHLQEGKTDTFRLTFLPGDTLAKHRVVLEEAGYSDASIDAAFDKQYDHPLFATKPAAADLEGYIYGETYEFLADVSVETILERTFDEFYAYIKQEELQRQYKQQGLTLYEGITLASIIQREVPTSADQRQVAQVFLTRLAIDMQLGSDVTYQYIADKTGQARSPDLDSPYNTRRYKGLPPGPIASPGASALAAVGDPAKGDFIYFLSGDDDMTYFARTNQEHEENIRKHCQQKCQIL